MFRPKQGTEVDEVGAYAERFILSEVTSETTIKKRHWTFYSATTPVPSSSVSDLDVELGVEPSSPGCCELWNAESLGLQII